MIVVRALSMDQEEDDTLLGNIILFGIIIAVATLFGFFMNVYMVSKHPTALDVYNGKTTLEITYKDSIPVDTVVVFKD